MRSRALLCLVIFSFFDAAAPKVTECYYCKDGFNCAATKDKEKCDQLINSKKEPYLCFTVNTPQKVDDTIKETRGCVVKSRIKDFCDEAENLGGSCHSCTTNLCNDPDSAGRSSLGFVLSLACILVHLR